jgi:3-oxocholest-4-en-26-oate---CoA ligase
MTGAASGLNLAAVHEAIAAARPDRECIVFGARRLSWADVNDRTRRLANVLASAGLGARPDGRQGLAGHESHQDHLAICAFNGNEYLEAMIGAFKARVAPLNVNYRYVADELRHVLTDSGARAVVFHAELAPTLAEVLEDLPPMVLMLQIADDSGNDLLPGARWYEDALATASGTLPACAADWSPDDLYILYTGGTTGPPKGVLWRQADILASVMGGADTGRRKTMDEMVATAMIGTGRFLPAAPFMHGAGQWIAFLGMHSGGPVVIQDEVRSFDPADLLRVCERERVSYLQIIGDAFARPLVEQLGRQTYDLSALQVVLSGGTALQPAVKDQLLELLPHVMVIDGVGSSEGGSQAIHVSVKGTRATTGTFTPVGTSCVLDAERTRLLDPGEEKIGWWATRSVVPLGYLGAREKSAETFPEIDGIRYSIPGDRARLLSDGSIELLGRDSVTINSGGEKIFVEEVEAPLARHPAVEDVLVCGRPSERWGQEVVAIVQLVDDVDPSDSIEADLRDACAAYIAHYKVPKAFVFVDAIQRSASGKPDYRWGHATAENVR